MRNFSFFRLKIHCWGGLGSQLFALAIANDVQKKYKKRKIFLILHTSGVSKRLSELDFITDLTFKVLQVYDYQNISNNSFNSPKSFKTHAKEIIKKILIQTKFICLGNTDTEFKKIVPWTLSLRGHYSYRSIEADFYNYLINYLNLKIIDTKIKDKSTIAIHYRMGDLLKLTNKSIYPVEKIIKTINEIVKNLTVYQIIVYSDSPDKAKSTLISAGLRQDFMVRNIPTIDVISECVVANYFIGTNSKVSLWIVNLRRYLGQADSSFLEGFDSQLYKL
jgi:hypothetical protein